MAPESETEDEFSLMDVRKLIRNLPRRKLEVKLPCFAVFALWISRICKPQAWKEIFIVCSYYLALYNENKSKLDKLSELEKWHTFWEEFDSHKKGIYKGMGICNEKSGLKFL